MEIKKIFSKWMAIELRKAGFKIIRVEPNINCPQFDVYIFEESKALESKVTELINGSAAYKRRR